MCGSQAGLLKALQLQSCNTVPMVYHVSACKLNVAAICFEVLPASTPARQPGAEAAWFHVHSMMAGMRQSSATHVPYVRRNACRTVQPAFVTLINSNQGTPSTLPLKEP